MDFSEKKWLVKSGSFIFGPFDDESVKSQLRDKTLTIRDEVIGPMKNWVEINDSDDFADVVEELRIKSLEEELNDATDSKTLISEQTQDIEDVTQVTNLDALEVEKEAPRGTFKKFSRRTAPQAIKKPSQDPTHIAQPIESVSKSKIITNLLILVSFPVFVYVAYNQVKLSKEADAKAFEQLGTLNKDYDLQSYQKVITNLEGYFSKGQLPEDLFNLLVKSYIAEGDYDQALITIDSQLAEDFSSSKKNNFKGLIFYKKGENGLANTYFNNSITEDTDHVVAYINLLINNMSSDQINKYVDRINLINEKLYSVGEYFYVYLVASVEAYKKTKNNNYLENSLQLISRYADESNPYYLQIGVIEMYMKSLLGSYSPNFAIEMGYFDFDYTHIKNLILNGEVLQLSDVINPTFSYCQGVVQSLTDESLFKPYCYGVLQDKEKQINLLTANKNGEHPVVLGLLALAQKDSENLGRDFEQVLKNAENKNASSVRKYKLPYILRIESCLQNSNVDCLKKTSMNLLKLNPRSVKANYAEAFQYNVNKEFNKSFQTIQNFAANNKSYLPSLQLLASLDRYVN